jgi:hypothetical protein
MRHSGITLAFTSDFLFKGQGFRVTPLVVDSQLREIAPLSK